MGQLNSPLCFFPSFSVSLKSLKHFDCEEKQELIVSIPEMWNSGVGEVQDINDQKGGNVGFDPLNPPSSL